MTKEEIKQNNPMIDVVRQYGVKVRRDGMCSCPFHGEDKNPSMKIYRDSYYCFACQRSGDIFTFVQEASDCDFKTAFYMLGGTYDHEDKIAKLRAWRAQKGRETAAAKREKLKRNRRHYQNMMHIYREGWQKLGKNAVFSDEWCRYMRKYEHYRIKTEEITKEIDTTRGL